MMPLAEIYQMINDGLRASGIPYKWFDLDMGQTEDDGLKLPLSYPAILLKIGDVIWKDTDSGYQIGTATISAKVIFQFQNEAETLTMQAGGRTEVLDNLEMLESINQLITALGGTTFNQMRRFNQYHLEVKPKELLWVHVMQYQCNIYSNSDTPESALLLDFDDVKNNNAFMERKKNNLIHK